MPSTAPTASVNNRIPPAVLWAFGIGLPVLLVLLPFLVFKVLATTQNQAQGMTLAGAAALPIPSASMRCTVRENRDKSRFAARYELAPETLVAVREKLAAHGRPADAWFADLDTLSPRETGWQPNAQSPGPWRTAAGSAGGLAWRAALDESTGTLWIHAARADDR